MKLVQIILTVILLFLSSHYLQAQNEADNSISAYDIIINNPNSFRHEEKFSNIQGGMSDLYEPLIQTK